MAISHSLLELLAECRALVHLGVAIPDSAQGILEQEGRIKLFRQQLQGLLEELYSVVDGVDSAVRPLMEGHVETVLR